MKEITGGCHCGDVRYQASVDPKNVRICHCIDCQKISGSAFRSIVISEPNSFNITKGLAKEYIKVAESGNHRAQGFCQNCGSSLYATTEAKTNRIYGIRLGSVDQRDEFTPKYQIWSRSAAPWIKDLAKIPAYETTPSK